MTSRGHTVEVCLEAGAEQFVGPAAFLACGAVVVDSGRGPVWGPQRRPAAVILAPACSGLLARLAWGMADSPAVAIAVDASLVRVIVPELDAMTREHPAVQENLRLLAEDGFRVLDSESEGEMVGEILAATLGGMGGKGGDLAGRRVVVSAGGTHEPLDSVRFIGNRSSGKMGLAVARAALHRGAEVTVVAANIGSREPGVAWVPVETVAEMERASVAEVREADALVMAAAVSDFTPSGSGTGKVRRRDGLKVEFEPTTDILESIRRRYSQLAVVGFAATFGDPRPDAREKLERKGANVVVGNDISRAGIGFGADENEVCIVTRETERLVGRTSKEEVAHVILDVLVSELNAKG